MTADFGPTDEPEPLADRIAAEVARPLLVGLDIDGVLSPIVEHAQQSSLLPGVLDDVVAVSRACPVAIVSGRDITSIESLFGFPDHLTVIGTHGLERRGTPAAPTGEEADRLAELVELGQRAADRAGEGAWLEHKPMAVVLHTRQATAHGRAVEAATWLAHAGEQVEGATVKLSHFAVELLARPASKATAIEALRTETGAASVLFVGDDVTDEEVFATLGEGDWSVRVGPGQTTARHRLADPVAVQRFLHRLAIGLRQ